MIDGLHDVPRTSATFAARVFANVETTASCWWWGGTLDQNGYGILGRGKRGAGNIAAHRAVYELLVGPIPDGLVFDHLCRNHVCVNPDHGEIVTLEENIRRGFGLSVLHAKRTHCKHGHPLDGMTGARGGRAKVRYCKTCAKQRSNENYRKKREAHGIRDAAYAR